MTPLDCLAYLWGSREAIQHIAAAPGSLGVGALLVLTAAIARAHARTDLLREPWHLLAPYFASWATCTLLFGILMGLARSGGQPMESLGTLYSSLLALYWMTAPLAWLYAIPFERWLDAEESVAARLRTLAVVAIWRVALMVRVVVVMVGAETHEAVVVVLLFGAIVTVSALATMKWQSSKLPPKRRPSPLLLDAMAAIHHGATRLAMQDEEDQVQVASGCIFALAIVSLPVLLVMLVFAYPRIGAWDWSQWSNQPELAVHNATWWCVSAAVLGWLLALPRPQRRLRLAVEAADKRSQQSLSEWLAWLGQHSRSEFPVVWQPPPAGDYSQEPFILDVVEAIQDSASPRWLHTEYDAQLRDYLDNAGWYWPHDHHLQRLAKLLPSLSAGAELAGIAVAAIQRIEKTLELGKESSPDDEPVKEIELPDWIVEIPLPSPSHQRNRALEAIQRLAPQRDPQENHERWD